MFYREQSYSYDFTIPADDYNLNALGDVDLREELCWDEQQYITRIDGIPIPMSGILKVTGISDGRLSVQFAERNEFWEKAKGQSLSGVVFYSADNGGAWPSMKEDIFPLLEETRYYHEVLGSLPTGDIKGFVAVSLRLLIKGCVSAVEPGYSVDDESLDSVAFSAKRYGRFVVSHFPNATLDSFKGLAYEGLGIKEVRFKCSTTIGTLLQDIATICCGRFIVDNDTRLVRFVTFAAGYTSPHQHFGAIRFPMRYKLDLPAPLQAEGDQIPTNKDMPSAAKLPDYVVAPITISATINNKSYIQEYKDYLYRIYPPYVGLSIFDADAAAIVRDERKKDPKELRVPLLLQQPLNGFDDYRLKKYTNLGDTLYSVEGSDKYTWKHSGCLKEMSYRHPHNEVSHNFKRGTWAARARNEQKYIPKEVPITGYDNSQYDINIDSSGYIPDIDPDKKWSRNEYKNRQGGKQVTFERINYTEGREVTYGYAYIYAPPIDPLYVLHSLAVATKNEQDMAELNTLYLRTDGFYDDGFSPKGKRFESERPPQPDPGTPPTPPTPKPKPPKRICTIYLDNGYGVCRKCGKAKNEHPQTFQPAPGGDGNLYPSDPDYFD